MKRYKQLILGAVTFVIFGVGNVYSDPLTLQTASAVYPTKSSKRVREAVELISKQEKIPITIESFSSPVEYMKRLRALKRAYPNRVSGEADKGETRCGETGSIQQLVHSWSDLVCVKSNVPKVYKVTILLSGSCPDCSGRGSHDTYVPKTEIVKCPKCSGRGKHIKPINPKAQGRPASGGAVGDDFIPCEKCKGEGTFASTHTQKVPQKCRTCNGSGKLDAQRREVKIVILDPLYGSTEH